MFVYFTHRNTHKLLPKTSWTEYCHKIIYALLRCRTNVTSAKMERASKLTTGWQNKYDRQRLKHAYFSHHSSLVWSSLANDIMLTVTVDFRANTNSPDMNYSSSSRDRHPTHTRRVGIEKSAQYLHEQTNNVWNQVMIQTAVIPAKWNEWIVGKDHGNWSVWLYPFGSVHEWFYISLFSSEFRPLQYAKENYILCCSRLIVV